MYLGRDKIQYKGVAWVAVYKSIEIRISENKIADPIRRTVFPESCLGFTQNPVYIKGVLRSLITNLESKIFKNKIADSI